MARATEDVIRESNLKYALARIQVAKEEASKLGYRNARPWVLRRHTDPETNVEIVRRLIESGKYKDVYIEEHIEDVVFNISW